MGTHLEVDTSHLAIGGFSFGGTCGLQPALRRPDAYRTFLDISCQAHPRLGDLRGTVIDGIKHPLSLVEGSTGNTTLVTELIVGLRNGAWT